MNPFSNGRPNLSAGERIRNKRASTIYNAASRAFNPGPVQPRGGNGAPCRNYNGNIGFYRYGRLRNATNYRLLDDLNRGYALCRDCPDCPTGIARGTECPGTYNIGPTMGLSSFMYYFGGGGPLGFRDTVITTYSCTGGHGSVSYSGATGFGCHPGSVTGWTGATMGLYNNNEITMPFNSEGVGVVIDPSNNLQTVTCTSKRPHDGKYLKLIAVEQGLQVKGFLQPFVGLLFPVPTPHPFFPYELIGFGPVGQFRTCQGIRKSLTKRPVPRPLVLPPPTIPTPALPPYTPAQLAAATLNSLNLFIASWAVDDFAMSNDNTMKGWRVVSGGLWGKSEGRFGLRGVGTLMNNPVDCCTEVPTLPAGTPPLPDDIPTGTAGKVTTDIKIFAQHFYERNDVGNFPGVSPDTIGLWIINPLSLTADYPFVFGYTLGLSPGNLDGQIAAFMAGIPPYIYYTPAGTPDPTWPGAPPPPTIGGDGGEKLFPYWNYQLEYTGKALCGPNLTTGNDLQHSYLTCLGNPGKVAFAIPLQGCCGAGATGCAGFLQNRRPLVGTNPDS